MTVLKFPICYKSFASLLPSNLFLFNRKDKVHISAVWLKNAAWKIAVTRSRYWDVFILCLYHLLCISLVIYFFLVISYLLWCFLITSFNSFFHIYTKTSFTCIRLISFLTSFFLSVFICFRFLDPSPFSLSHLYIACILVTNLVFMLQCLITCNWKTIIELSTL